MVAIVSGKGVGLERSSAWVLGSAGQLGTAGLGRGGDNVYLNGANGNLVITRQDEFLIGRGPDISIDRTYNSQGDLSDDNGDNWRMGVYRKLTGIPGSYGAAGSTVKRIDWDGSDTLYTWNAAKSAYVATDGAGAYDTLTRSGTIWTWTDGNSRITELYDQNLSGRLTTTKDIDNNTLTYTYNGSGLITRVTSNNAAGTADDEWTDLTYVGNQLTQITTQGASGRTRVFYEYDGYGRLWKVKVNLDPADNSKTVGANYETVYGYDGSSKRVTSITQSDGTALTIVYGQSGSVYRVSQLIQTASTGITRTTYIYYNGGGTGFSIGFADSSYSYVAIDGNQNMTLVVRPNDTNTLTTVDNYTYNGSGDLVSQSTTDGSTIVYQKVDYQYDSNGNRTLETGAEGTKVKRVYSSKNELIVEMGGTIWPGIYTERRAYDAAGHLRYVLGPTGVTEYVIELNAANPGYGKPIATIEYTGSPYSGQVNWSDNSVTLAAVDNWVATIDKSKAVRTRMEYDFRGNLKAVESYSKLTSTGQFDLTSELSRTDYVYDQAGNLLSRFATLNGVLRTESFVYDGLNRLIASTDPDNNATNIVFYDATATTVVNHANGLIQTSLYNKAGELITFTESGADMVSAVTQYRYDAAGRLRNTTDPNGNRTYFFYDAGGRKIADVDSDGTFIEYRYDAVGNLTSTTEYFNKLTTYQLGMLADANGNPTSVYFPSLRPPTNDADRWTWQIYDGASRLVRTIDETGATTAYTYDTTSRLISTRQYANLTSASALAQLKANPRAVNYTDPSNQALNPLDPSAWWLDMVDWSQHGTINGVPAFYMATTNYDEISTVMISPDAWPSGPAVVTYELTIQAVEDFTHAFDFLFYNPEEGSWYGDVSITTLFGPGSLTNLGDGMWRISNLDHYQPTRLRITAAVGPGTANGAASFIFYLNRYDAQYGPGAYEEVILSNPFASTMTFFPPPLPAVSATNDRVTRYFYEENDLLMGTLDADGYLTKNVYDKAGRKTQTIAYSGATAEYLRAEGSLNSLAGSITLDNAKDIRNYFVYDARGLLRATVDGEGGLTRYHYNPLREIDEIVTGQKLDPAALITTPPTFANLPTAPAGTILETTIYSRNLYGQILDETKVLNANTTTVTTYAYDAMHRLVSTTTDIEEAARAETRRYDKRGNLKGELSGIGSALLAALGPDPDPELADPIWAEYGTLYGYDAGDRLISTSDPNGNRTLFYYDVDDRLAYQVDGVGAVVEYRYDVFGQRTDTIVHAVPIDSETLWELTGGAASAIAGIVAALADASVDQAAHVEFNLDGSVKQTTDPLGQLTTFSYNSFGELKTEVAPLGVGTTITTNFTYDRRGLLKTEIVDDVTSGKKIKTSYGYDAFGRLVLLTDPALYATSSTYDRAGRLTAVTDAQAHVTRYKYDARGNLVAVTDAANQVTRFVYDNGGRRIYAIDALGGVIRTNYDGDGRAVATIAYANAISLAGLGEEIGQSDVTGRLTANAAKDRTTRSAYDLNGRLQFSLDPLLAPIEYRYDDSGHLIALVEYAGVIDPTGEYSADYVAGQIASKNLAAAPDTRITRTVYDPAGRVAFVVDAEGAAVQSTYDSAGRLIRQRAYATPYPDPGDIERGMIESWAAGIAGADDHVSRAFYDRNGRLVFSVDAEDYVTEYRYNRQGSVVDEIRYADPYGVGDEDTLASLQNHFAGATPGSAAVSSFGYDSAGRLEAVRDAEGYWTKMQLDARGLALSTKAAWGTADESETIRVYDALGRVTSETRAAGTAYAITTSCSYDAVGNKETETDALGAVTTRTFDALGRVLTVSVPVDPYTAHNLLTTNQYDAFGNLVKVTDPRGNSGYFYYDRLGRLSLQVDPEKYVTGTTYTLFGETDTVTRYAKKASNAPDVTTPPALVPDDKDATTSFDYDHLGRLISVTDAESHSESYDLDAFGNRVTVHNKLNHATLYTFDKLNRVETETLPVSAVDVDGDIVATAVTTRYVRDGRGNVTAKVEAEGIAGQQRTTSYVYDKLDRLTRTDYAAVVVTRDDFTQTTVTPSESFSYDGRGNIILTVDTGGRKTYAYFDLAGRKTDELVEMFVANGVAKGTLSHWAYDANGNVLSARVYDGAVAEPASLTRIPPDPADPAKYRETFYTYDRANRLYSTSVGDMFTGDWNGVNYVMQERDDPEYTEHDAAGNVTREIVDHFAYRNFYDKAGHRIGRIGDGFTIWEYDAEGNVTKETRRAGIITAIPQNNWTLDDLYAAAAPSADDRITLFTYDRNGRRLTETRLNVAVSTFTAGGADVALADATIHYSYDALGNVTRKEEANGDATDFTYDEIGRLRRATSAEFTDDSNAAVRPETESLYDGLGNVVRVETGKAGDLSANDRVTRYVYGAGGRLASMTDATGFTHSYDYDSAGRVVRHRYSRLQPDLATSVDEAIVYRYDLAGRLITQATATDTGAGWIFGDSTRIRYNAFGEVTGRGLTGGPDDAAAYQETFDYDRFGRMWRSTDGDGTAKLYIQNAGYQTTMTIASVGTDLRGYASIDDMLTQLNDNNHFSIGNTAKAGVTFTVSIYNGRDLVQTRERFRELNYNSSGAVVTTSSITKQRAYNAFGEVISESDGRGFTTDFAYNTMGRMISKTSPFISFTEENGTVHASERVTDHYHYDIAGRMIATQDANGHWAKRALLAGSGHGQDEALVTAEFHPDGILATKYDVFGEATVVTDELGHAETRTYDEIGRITGLVHRGGGLTDSFFYDGLGQRIRHVQHWSATGADLVETTEYDRQGRVITQIDTGGYDTHYSYVWDAGMTTAGGLGTFGGWIKGTINTSNIGASEQLDYFGRTVSRTDFGGHTYSFVYDLGGRLSQETGAAGQSMTYTWFNTGKVGKAIDVAGTGLNTITSTFGYDKDGNRTYEGYSGTVISYFPTGSLSATTLLQNATIAYDGLDRITSFTDKDAAGTTRITVTNEYDAVGNVRHVHSVYPDLAYPNQPALDTHQWFRYDSLDRMTVADGQLVNGAITGGEQISYDAAGRRATATRDAPLSQHVWKWVLGGIVRFYFEPLEGFENDGEWTEIDYSYGGPQVETYSYTDDGALLSVSVAEATLDLSNHRFPAVGPLGPSVLRAEYERDGLGRVTRYREFDKSGAQVFERYSIEYDARSMIHSEWTAQVRGFNNTEYNHSQTYYTVGGLFEHVSVDTFKNTLNDNGDHDLPDTYTANTYTWYDDARVLTQAYEPNASHDPHYLSTYAYDGLGRIASVFKNAGIDSKVSFVYGAEGQTLARLEHRGSSSAPEAPGLFPEDHYYYADGIRLGDLTSNGGDPSENTYVQALAQRNKVQSPNATGPFRWGAFQGGTDGNFGQGGYSHINPLGQGTASTAAQYAVRDGDTLQSIALAAWGDASLWYLLAEANGLQADAMLVAGQSLIIPDRVTNLHNSTDTFKVYDPNKVLGDLAPTAAKPPKKGSNNCGIFGAVIVIIIAIVVTKIAGPYVGALVAKLGLGATATAVATAAATAAVASAVSQGVGVATGLQDKFSWKSVALAAISAGVAKGLEQVPGGVGTFFARDALLSNVARGAASSAITQGVAVATGLQKKFDWAAIATQAVVSGVTGIVSRSIGGQAPVDARGVPNGEASFLNQHISGAVGKFAGAAARSILTGTSFGDNVRAILPDVIGTTIGDAIAEGIRERPLAWLNSIVDSLSDGDATPMNPADARPPGDGTRLGTPQIIVEQDEGLPEEAQPVASQSVPAGPAPVHTFSDFSDNPIFRDNGNLPFYVWAQQGGDEHFNQARENYIAFLGIDEFETKVVSSLRLAASQRDGSAIEQAQWARANAQLIMHNFRNAQGPNMPLTAEFSDRMMREADYQLLQVNLMTPDTHEPFVSASENTLYARIGRGATNLWWKIDRALDLRSESLYRELSRGNIGYVTNGLPPTVTGGVPLAPRLPPVGNVAPLADDAAELAIRSAPAAGRVAEELLETGAYGVLRRRLSGTGLQANHLNQNAAFRTVIPESEGVAVGMRGNAITEIGSPHYEFHSSLEQFWAAYRRGGAQFGLRPTNAQYGAAVETALARAGVAPAEAARVSQLAAAQRAAYGLGPQAPVPRIPNPMGQQRRP